MILGFVGLILLVFFVTGVLYSFRSFRKAIALTMIIGGSIISLSLVGAIFGLPLIFFGAWLMYSEPKKNDWPV